MKYWFKKLLYYLFKSPTDCSGFCPECTHYFKCKEEHINVDVN